MEKVKKVVLITGASSGIGAALAKVALRNGSQVVLLARRQERLEAFCDKFDPEGKNTLPLRADVTKVDDLEQAVTQTIAKFGRLDIVFANAGFGVMGPVSELEIKDIQRQLDTNLFGVIRTIQASLPELRKTKGSIGAVGSVMGYLSLPNGSPYGMSKFAVRALCQSLWGEEPNVSVTHIAPGFVKSEIRRVDNSGNYQHTEKDPIPLWIQMDSDKAATKIFNAVVRRKKEVIITFHGKFVVWLVRHFSRLAQLAISSIGIRSRPPASSSE